MAASVYLNARVDVLEEQRHACDQTSAAHRHYHSVLHTSSSNSNAEDESALRPH
jgi:hypothetical protein